MEELFRTSPGGFFEEMLRPYLSITEGQLQRLERSLEQGDARSVQTIAHTVKGASLNLGFVGMGSHASALEEKARDGGTPDVTAAALFDEFRRVVAFAERRRQQGGDA
jgi:HPt (histidine-containing phosphotransfer) domain-containing protein